MEHDFSFLCLFQETGGGLQMTYNKLLVKTQTFLNLHCVIACLCFAMCSYLCYSNKHHAGSFLMINLVFIILVIFVSFDSCIQLCTYASH